MQFVQLISVGFDAPVSRRNLILHEVGNAQRRCLWAKPRARIKAILVRKRIIQFLEMVVGYLLEFRDWLVFMEQVAWIKKAKKRGRSAKNPSRGRGTN